MDTLPEEELIKVIISLTDDKTKRFARLVNTQWFRLSNYRSFTIYLTRKSEWKQIVDRLARYEGPIALQMAKNIMQDLKDINEHLTRLTNLTDLNIANMSDPEPTDQWTLTVLSNLTNLFIPIMDSDLPFAFPKLEILYASFMDAATKSRKLPNVREIHAWDTLVGDSFAYLPWTLTRLALNCDKIFSLNEKTMSRFTELKVLALNIRNTPSHSISLAALTALEALELRGIIVHSVTSTHLTRVKLTSRNISILEGRTNLRRLDLSPTDNSISVQFFMKNRNDPAVQHTLLTALTQLERVRMSVNHKKALQCLNSSRLTRLTCELTEAASGALVLSHLTGLQYLSLKRTRLDDPAQLNTLTNLTSLALVSYNKGKTVLNLSSLTKLRALICTTGCDIDVSALTTLEYLCLPEPTSTKSIWGLERLTRLTYLESAAIPACVSAMTQLKVVRTKHTPWCHLAELTNLEEYSAAAVNHEDDLLYLTAMHRLTRLAVQVGNVSGVHLTRLTALQDLNFPHNTVACAYTTQELHRLLPHLIRCQLHYRVQPLN